MKAFEDDPFEVMVIEPETEGFSLLAERPVTSSEPTWATPNAEVATVHGFDHDDRPLLAGLRGLPGEIVRARTATPLRSGHIGSTVVLVFEQGDWRRPIVIGVIQESTVEGADPVKTTPAVSAQLDDNRLVLMADREVVLRCGEASITLTRAGKVLIRGTYVLSRSSGYNKIKGAAVDIN